MKFKTIYILFNTVIVLSFAFIFFMPLLLLGADYFSLFVSKNWIAGLLFLLTLIIINGYFLSNWRLFRLLEREDWHGLIRHLEAKVFEKSRLHRNYIKMLINAYLVISRVDKISELESVLREKGSRFLKVFALQLGIPYLLNMRDDPVAAEKYFGRHSQDRRVRHRDWLRWNYAFALLEQRAFEAAKVTLLQILDGDPDPSLRLLTVYILASLAHTAAEIHERVAQDRRRLAALYSPEQWDRKIESSSRHIQIVLLTPMIREAKDWLFGKREAQDQKTPSKERTVH